jgi:glutathione S-transferase
MAVSFVSTQTSSSLTLYPPCVTVHTVELTLSPPPDISHRWRLTLHTNKVDPYKKPADLLEFSSKGLVPGLKLHTYTRPRALNECIVILAYLEEYVTTNALLPSPLPFKFLLPSARN